MQILVVEDNPAEARLTREALAESGFEHRMDLVGDGEQAIAFLRREGSFWNAAKPDLVLLDLNLPRKDGRAVLRDIKSDRLLASIPIIVVTNSRAQEDVEEIYRLRANCYLVKPPDIEDFFLMVKRIMEFWSETARLPRGINTQLIGDRIG